jgi:Ferritin-like domain
LIPTVSNRRAFLACSGAVAAAAAGLAWPLGALATPTPSPTPFPWTDADLLQTLASIENLAIATYGQILALPAALTGAADPSVSAVLNTALSHHRSHAGQLNSILSNQGAAPQPGVDTALQSDVVSTNLAAAQNSGDVLAVAVAMEDAAVQTYVRFSSGTRNLDTARTLALIAPVEAQHLSALLMLESLISDEQLAVLATRSTPPADTAGAGLTEAEIPSRHSRHEREGALS